MRKLLTIPFTFECVLNTETDSVYYIIVRDLDARVVDIETSTIGAAALIDEVLEEFVFSKKKKDEKS